MYGKAKINKCCTDLVTMGFDPVASKAAAKVARGEIEKALLVLDVQRQPAQPIIQPVLPSAPAKEDSDNNGEEAEETVPLGLEGKGQQLAVSSDRKQERQLVRAAKKQWLSQLDKGSFLDVRDDVGKWLEAEILKVTKSPLQGGTTKIYVKYLRFSSKFNEWLSLSTAADTARLAEFHTRASTEPRRDCPYRKAQVLEVLLYTERPRRWTVATVEDFDGSQMQVKYQLQGRRRRHWYHIDSKSQVRALGGDPTAAKKKKQKPREKKYAASSKVPFAVNAVKAVTAKPATAVDTTVKVKEMTVAGQRWFLGQYLEVKGVVGRWETAQVIRVSPKTGEIRVHYDNWGKRWDQNLSVLLAKDKKRIRLLGSTLKKSVQELKISRDDIKLRQQITSLGFTIVDTARDGNCLFRSICHQVYSDAERHPGLRTACYDYMVENKEYFGTWIGVNFEAYLVKQRQLNEWGDHIEIVALRELLNVNIEIYDLTNKTGPRPVGFTTDLRLPVIRLAYHGGNHYNSVVEPEPTHWPLGDGTALIGEVSFRAQRIAEESKSKSGSTAVVVVDDEEGVDMPSLSSPGTILPAYLEVTTTDLTL